MTFRDLTVTEAAARRGAARFIDVRETDELVGDLGHIQGIEHVPLATVATAAADWARDQPLVIVCRSGGRSGKASATLDAMGFADVSNMTGGMLAWNEAGLPVTRDR